jgi:hypothetical protein
MICARDRSRMAETLSARFMRARSLPIGEGRAIIRPRGCQALRVKSE